MMAAQKTGIEIGKVRARNRVFLAPMSGVTDEPFRLAAHHHGAGLVVSEMVASEELVRARPDMVRRATGAGRVNPFVIQLAGREPRWMAEGARLAADLGAEVIDINMGCPARQVTGGLSGSALMRDLDHAMTLVEATVEAVNVPVTLKMRLGWDHGSLNAPELARRAEQAGVALVTVHGRTRCQFYGGKADWPAIRRVREAISIPLIANGDCATAENVRAMLEASGADGVMVGRSAYGRPWWPGVLAERLDPGSGIAEPTLAAESAIVGRHHAAIVEHYGTEHGNRMARKHVGWTIDRLAERRLLDANTAKLWRDTLLRTSSNDAVAQGLADLYDACAEREAA
ncbi:MAG: tRNA dihydrouridine synthase DusB [Rhizobiales bacterium]|nr:tRNA dihydrouridine synthase DusB [Hyphomicrobiales bacterium]MBI3673548.1 tRNA dihydrouridine synthase DusB [Hyphomicrobiales bacterium]